MVQALHTNPVLWVRRTPQERHGNGTQCGRATEGDKKPSESEITRKLRLIMRCIAILMHELPKRGAKTPWDLRGIPRLGAIQEAESLVNYGVFK